MMLTALAVVALALMVTDLWLLAMLVRDGMQPPPGGLVLARVLALLGTAFAVQWFTDDAYLVAILAALIVLYGRAVAQHVRDIRHRLRDWRLD